MAQPNRQSEALQPTLCTVVEARQENHDTTTLVIDAQSSDSLLKGQPGQFNMLYGFGKGEIAISVSRFDAENGHIHHTIRAVGAVSRGLCDLKSGQTIGVRGPFGRGWPIQAMQQKDVYIIAGGMGLAPLRPVIDSLLSEQTSLHKRVLIYGARSPEDLVFTSSHTLWQEHENLDFYMTVDKATRDWRGHVGVVTPLLDRLAIQPDNAIALLCGPSVMMDFCVKSLKNQSVESDQMYLSLERNMKCGIGLCGHCQYGPDFICKNGPVFDYAAIAARERIREL